MGGLLALRLARLFPEQVSALVVMSTPLRLRPYQVNGIRALTRLPVDFKALPGVCVPKLAGSDISDPEMRYVNPGLRAFPLAALRALVDLMDDVRPDLPAIHTPTLVVHGRQDHTVPMEDSLELTGCLGSDVIERLWLDKSFHIVTLDVEKATSSTGPFHPLLESTRGVVALRPAVRDLVLAIDQGTTGTTVLVVDAARTVRGRGYREFAQIYPAPGWVEHDPEEIWASVHGALADALAGVDVAPDRRHRHHQPARDHGAVGPSDGRPVDNAIVWQDRRTAPLCAQLKAAGTSRRVRQRTGLVLDPYFSATKIGWLLDNVAGLRARAEAGELAFGTVDSFLVWRLTGGTAHATDVTNASRTLLFDLGARRLDDELCELFGVPRAMLPEVARRPGGSA